MKRKSQITFATMSQRGVGFDFRRPRTDNTAQVNTNEGNSKTPNPNPAVSTIETSSGFRLCSTSNNTQDPPKNRPARKVKRAKKKSENMVRRWLK